MAKMYKLTLLCHHYLSGRCFFLFLVLTLTHFYYYADNPHETYNYVLNGSSPHQGNQLNLKGFLFNLWDGILISLANEN